MGSSATVQKEGKDWLMTSILVRDRAREGERGTGRYRGSFLSHVTAFLIGQRSDLTQKKDKEFKEGMSAWLNIYVKKERSVRISKGHGTFFSNFEGLQILKATLGSKVIIVSFSKDTSSK